MYIVLFSAAQDWRGVILIDLTGRLAGFGGFFRCNVTAASDDIAAAVIKALRATISVKNEWNTVSGMM